MGSRVTIIGAGRVGTAIGVSLTGTGFEIAGVVSRKLTEATRLARRVGCSRFTQDPCQVVANSEIVFITTPDRKIAEVCRKIAPYVSAGTLVVHTSGALPSKILSPAKTVGALCLSMHPCQSFSDISTAPERLTGCYFCLEGDEEAVRRGEVLAKEMNCHSFVLGNSDKILYHIACSIASNYLVVLAEKTFSILEEIGVNENKTAEIIIPLFKGTMQNIEDLGVKRALTGPIERGEAETLRAEMEVIRKRLPELRALYTVLGKEAIKIAAKEGKLGPAASLKLTEILE